MKRNIRAGAGEKLQYLVHAYNDNTIRFVLRYPGMPDENTLRRAVRAVVASADVLHSAFVPGKISARWQDMGAEAWESCFEALDVSGDPVEKAVEMSLRPVAHKSPSQLRCTLVRGGGECAVAVAMSHLCVDGSDGKYLMEKLAEAYRLIAVTGSCNGIGVKSGTRSVTQLYKKLAPGQLMSLMRDPRSGVKSGFRFDDNAPGEGRMVRRMIDSGTMARAREKAHAQGATLNDVLLAACYHAYAASPGADTSDKMSITAMMDLRRHCPGGDSVGLSNLTGSLITSIPRDFGSFEAALNDIAAQTRRLKADPLAGLTGMPVLQSVAAAMPLAILEVLAGRVYGSMTVGMTNLGSLDIYKMELDGIIPAEGWFGGPLKKKPGMQVAAMSLGGSCALTITGSYADNDLPLLQALLDDMAAAIAEYAA